MYDIELARKLAESDESRLEAYKIYENHEFPKWKRLKVLDTQPPEYQGYSNQKVLFHNQPGLKVVPKPVLEDSDIDAIGNHRYGPSEKHKALVDTYANSGTRIAVESNIQIKEPIVIQLTMNEKNPLLLDRHTIVVGEQSAITVVLDYSDQDVKSYHSGVLNIIAGANAKVHIVKIQNLSDASTHIHGGLAIIGRDATVTYNSIDLGGGLVVTDYSSYLEAENSESCVDSIYLGEGRNRLDLGYNTYHNSRRSMSDVTVKGALLDESRKVFRGNLIFARGASKSKGSEEEFVILLDERVKADSIPALLCDEDDVQGEHAASAGQVDANKLFYLMSRGLTEKESKQMIIMASFAPIIEQLPIEGLKERIHETVGSKLADEL